MMTKATIEKIDHAMKWSVYSAFKEMYLVATKPTDKISIQKVMEKAAELYNLNIKPKENITADFVKEWCIWQTCVDVYARLEAVTKVKLIKK